MNPSWSIFNCRQLVRFRLPLTRLAKCSKSIVRVTAARWLRPKQFGNAYRGNRCFHRPRAPYSRSPHAAASLKRRGNEIHEFCVHCEAANPGTVQARCPAGLLVPQSSVLRLPRFRQAELRHTMTAMSSDISGCRGFRPAVSRLRGRPRQPSVTRVTDAIAPQRIVTEGNLSPLLPRMETEFQEIAPNTYEVTWLLSRDKNVLFRGSVLPLVRCRHGQPCQDRTPQSQTAAGRRLFGGARDSLRRRDEFGTTMPV